MVLSENVISHGPVEGVVTTIIEYCKAIKKLEWDENEAYVGLHKVLFGGVAQAPSRVKRDMHWSNVSNQKTDYNNPTTDELSKVFNKVIFQLTKEKVDPALILKSIHKTTMPDTMMLMEW